MADLNSRVSGFLSGGSPQVTPQATQQPIQQKVSSFLSTTPSSTPTPTIKPVGSVGNSFADKVSSFIGGVSKVNDAVGSMEKNLFSTSWNYASNILGSVIDTFSKTKAGKTVADIGSMLKDQAQNFKFVETLAPGEIGVDDVQYLKQKDTSDLFHIINKDASIAVQQFLQGASGGILKGATPQTSISEKIIGGLSNVLGSGSTIQAISGAFGSLINKTSTVAKFVEAYPKVAKVVMPLLTNVVGMDIYGQLDPVQEDRLKRLASDTVMGTIFTGTGFIKNAPASVAANFGLGYGLAKLNGASDQDAFISGGILAALDTNARVQQSLLHTQVKKNGAWDMSPSDARSAVASSPLANTPLGKEIVKKSFQAEEQGSNIRITVKQQEPTTVAKILGNKNPGVGNMSVDIVKAGEPLPKPKATTSPEESAKIVKLVPEVPKEATPVEKSSIEQLKSDPVGMVNKYIEKNGNYISSDEARPLFTGYDGTNTNDVQTASQAVRDMVYSKILDTQEGKGNNTGLFILGSPGVGKTEASKTVDNLKDFSFVYDTTIVKNQLQQALDKGYKADIAFVVRDPVAAWRDGVLPRIEEEGRIVTQDYFIAMQEKARDRFIALAKKYEGNKNADFYGIDNTGERGQSKLVGIDSVASFDYNTGTLAEEISKITKQAYDEGKINESQYKAISEGSQRSQASGKPQQADGGTTQPQKQSEVKSQEKQIVSDIRDAILSGDHEGAQAFYDSMKTDHPDLPAFEAIQKEVQDVQTQIIDEVKQDLKESAKGENPDDPTNRVLAIADKLGAHFKAPGAIWKITGKSREYVTPEGKILVGGDATSALDRLIYSTDIEGFNRNMRILSAKFDKVFTEIKTSLERGDTDGADYEAFKQRFSEWIAKRPSYSAGRSGIDTSRAAKGKQEAAGSGDKATGDNAVKQKYDYQSTQFNLPESEASKITAFAKTIPETDLYTEEGKNDYGIEKQPHITALYGLDNAITTDQVKKALSGGSVTATLGKISVFKNEDKPYDVLKVDVSGEDLTRINKELRTSLDTPGQTFTDYKPHITLAYVKKGAGDKYIGDTTFEGNKITFTDVSFSKNDGTQESISLVKKNTEVIGKLEDDIPKSIAEDAFNGTSFDPDKRGASVIRSYVDQITSDYQELMKQATTPEKVNQLNELMQYYRSGYKERIIAYLHSHARVMSTMIAGPANFPSSSNRKKSDAADNKLREAYDFRDKMVRKIENTLNPRTVSSDDPNAIDKLEEKLANLKRQQELMIAANKIIRSKKDVVERLVNELNIPEKQAFELIRPDFLGNLGFASYQLTNNNAKIKNTQDRINRMKRMDSMPAGEPIPIDGGSIAINQSANRIQISFDAIPSQEMRTTLKGSGFHWSPYNKVWQRQLTPNAIRDTEKIFNTTIRPQKAQESASVSFASVDNFADIPVIPSRTGEGAGQRSTRDYYNVKVIEFPEMVQLAKDLLGKYPVVKMPRERPTLGGTPAGLFVASGDGKIVLNPDIFASVEQAARTLAHELGHLTDYLPDKSMARGNILGRIGSMRRYVEMFLEEYPGSPLHPLTLEEIAQIKKLSEKQAASSNTGDITPEDVLAIWRAVEVKNKDLEHYIAKLDSEQKKEILKAALKGYLPEWVSYKAAPVSDQQLYERLLREEIARRGLYEKQVITKELKDLTLMWKPLNPEMLDNKAYLRYRFSAVEMYADAISVLFNDPVRLQEMAPSFYKGFFEYIDRKPEFRDTYFALQDELNMPDDVTNAKRLNEIYKGFDEAKIKREEISKRKTNSRTWLQNFVFNHVTKFDPIYRKMNDGKKYGIESSPQTKMRIALEEMQMADNENFLYLDKVVQEFIKPLYDIGLTEDDLGVMLKLERNLGDRSDIANPYGLQGEYAIATLDYFRKHLEDTKGITKENFNVLQQMARAFRADLFETVTEATRVGLYSKEFYKTKALPSKDSYVTYQVVDYIHDNYVAAGIKHAVGTLKAIENPMISSILKKISIQKQIEVQKGKKAVVDELTTHFAADITKAEPIMGAGGFTGRYKPKTIEENGKTTVLEPLELYEDGKRVAYNVDPYIKKMFDNLNPQDVHTIVKVSGKFNSLFRRLVTTYNLSWGFYANIARDSERTFLNLSSVLPTIGNKKGLSIGEFVGEWLKAVPEAYKYQKGQIDTIVKDMMADKAYSASFSHFDPTLAEDTALAPILKKYNLIPKDKASENNFASHVMKPIKKLLEGIEFAGSVFEVTPKIAAYQITRKRTINTKLAGYIVRNYAGTPNFLDGGAQKYIDNQVWVFSNMMVQGFRTDFEIGTNPTTKSGYWFRMFIMGILPKLLMAAGAAGVFGAFVKDILDKQSEYTKTNYIVLPVGMTKNGKGIAISIPMHETHRFFGAIAWKAASVLSGSLKKPEQLFSVGAGFLPSMTPIWDVISGWIGYLEGRNPYDSFRGRLVVDDITWKAGGFPAFSKMVQWTMNEVGLSTFATYDKGNNTTFENIMQFTPIINRMFKVTDYGLTEVEQQIRGLVDQQNARQTLKEREVLKKYIQLSQENPGKQTEYTMAFVKDVLGNPPWDKDEQKKVTALKKKFLIGTAKGSLSREVDTMISITNLDARFEIMKQNKQRMAPDAYADLKKTLLQYKIITPEFNKRLNINKL